MNIKWNGQLRTLLMLRTKINRLLKIINIIKKLVIEIINSLLKIIADQF